MRWLLISVAGWLLAVQAGCAFGPSGETLPPSAVVYQNPALIPATNHEVVWDHVADVLSGFFRIQAEQRVQVVGNVISEGSIDTYPEGGATLLEPHRSDSVGAYNRWESTLQTIRRHAHVRVIPAQGGFLVEVIVEKELEDLPQPEQATAGAATFRNDSSPHDRLKTGPALPMPPGWIALGRDVALEQRILAEIHARLGTGLGTGDGVNS